MLTTESYELLLGRFARLETEVGTARDLTTICRALHEFAAASAPCNGMFISRYDPEFDRRVCIFAISEGEEQDVAALPPMPMNNSPQSRAVRSGEIVLIDDFQAAVANQPVVNLGLHRDPRLPQSAIAVPMKVRGRVVGAFEIQCVQPCAYRDEHAIAMQMAGNLAAIAIENLELLRKERDQRRAAEASETRFRALIEHSADATIAFQPDGEITYASPAATRILGYPEGELLITNLFTLIHPEDLPAMTERFQHLKAAPGQLEYQKVRCRHRDGTWCWIAGHTRNLLEVTAVRAFVGNYHDVTDQMRAEAALRENEERFRMLFEDNPSMLLLHDVESLRILAVNRAFVRHYGFSREELLGMTIRDIRPPDEVPKLRQALQSVETDGTLRFSAWRHRKKDGTVFEVDIVSHALDFGGRPARLTMVSDVSERLKLEVQLRQAQKMESIGQLAGGVAHDFNNLLTVIQGHSSLLLGSGQLHGINLDSTQQIAHAAARAGDLTRQLLTFSRKQAMELQVLDLNHVVRDLSRMFQRVLGETITLETECCTEPGLVKADAGMIEQVLMNLAVNARDAMPNGGKLTITTERHRVTPAEVLSMPEASAGDYLRLRVRDSGSGIAPEDLPRIFDPFFTTKEPGKGTGLGLATVYGIVKQHAGWINVRSQPGKGTEFEIHLPLAPASATPRETKKENQGMKGGNETILVVEDDMNVRSLVCSVLERFGYRVLEASTGRIALEIFDGQKSGIDLVMTDLVLPDGITGRQLADKILELRPGTKIVYSSGYGITAAGVDFSGMKGLRFIQKPYPVALLIQTIRECLDHA